MLTLLALVVAFGSACGASSSRSRIPLLSRSPLDAANHRVDRALNDARERATRQPAYTASVRYNPATCACPSWEAVLYGRWQRVDLQPTPTREEQKMTQARLQLTGENIEGASGWRYPTLRWSPIPADALAPAP